MKKLNAVIGMVVALVVLLAVKPVYAQEYETDQINANHQAAPFLDRKIEISVPMSVDTQKLYSVPQAQIFTPKYPIGIDAGESKLVEYTVKESGNASGELTSRTFQFFTQYDIPLSEPIGPFPIRVHVKPMEKSSWNELVYLPASVVNKARSMDEYAIVIKTNFTGKTSSGAQFETKAQLLLLLPPAAFSKSIPANGEFVQPGQFNLKWNSSVGAIEYQYCIDRIDNNSCDTDWLGTYWLGTYDTNAMLKNLAADETYYWQVRAVNLSGTTYANNGKFWKFTSLPNPPNLLVPTGGEYVDSRRPSFMWSYYPSAVSYRIQVSKTTDFSQVILDATSISKTYTPSVDLPANSTLYWRVRMKTLNGFTNWSKVESFVTPNPPSIPLLISPTQDTLIRNLRPVFNWSDSILPNSSPAFWAYEIEVAQDQGFSLITIDELAGENNVTSSNFTPIDDLQPNTKYYWRVRAFNENGDHSSWSAVWSFRVSILPPILKTPTDTEQLFNKRPSFDWENVDGATGYKIVISKNSNLSNPIRNVATLGSSLALSSDLPANTLLYWRVQATGLNGPSLWSETWSFRTGNPPSVPTLVSPVYNALLRDYTPFFNWNNASIPRNTTFQAYQIQVDNNRDFSSPAVDAFTTLNTITDSDFTPDHDLESNTKYYWRVRAYNNAMQYSAWSTVWSCRTALLPPDGLSVTTDVSNPGKPTFEWVQVLGASSYTIQVSTSPTFGTLLINATTSNTTYIPSAKLPTNKTLYWRVRSNGANGPSRWATSQL